MLDGDTAAAPVGLLHQSGFASAVRAGAGLVLAAPTVRAAFAAVHALTLAGLIGASALSHRVRSAGAGCGGSTTR